MSKRKTPLEQMFDDIKMWNEDWNLYRETTIGKPKDRDQFTEQLKGEYTVEFNSSLGQHTRFDSSAEVHEAIIKIEDALYDIIMYHPNTEQQRELLRVIDRAKQKISVETETDYYDVFRTSKRNEDGSYTDDKITSKEECFEWINEPNNKVFFPYGKERAIEQLNEFWDEYPDGIIYFG